MEKLNVTMKDYILETPQTVLNNLENCYNLTDPLVHAFLKKTYNRIIIVASGSSCNASHMARHFMMKQLNMEVKIVTPFTFTNYEHNVKEDDFVICVSQSGCSTNTIKALRKCRELGIPAIGLTGNVNSDFKTEADLVIDYCVGIELVGYVTKGVVTLSLFLMLFALNANIDSKLKDRVFIEKDIKKAMTAHAEMVEAFDKFYAKNRKSLTSMTNLYTIGCGANMGTVMEGALKVGETVHIPSVCYEVDEYIHGPNLQLTPNYTVIFVDGGDEAGKRCVQAYHATRTVTDRCFIITNDPSVDEDHAIRIPSIVREELTPLHHVVFFQLLAHTVSTELRTMPRHPLFTENFHSKIDNKSETYVDHHEELFEN